MAQSRAIITGAGGMLASDIEMVLPGEALFEEVIPLTEHDLDIRDEEAVFGALRKFAPSVILNCAAYTDVEGAETNQEIALEANARGPGNLARAAFEVNALLLHVSTDFVFDGRKKTPYTEEDAPNPVSVYGLSKLKGEEAVRSSGCEFLIVRTAWLYGRRGKNFVKRILGLSRGGKALRVVADQRGSPTWTLDLAKGIIALLKAEALGVFHFANAGSCTWFEFAREIVKLSGRSVEVKAVRSEEYPSKVKRPANSVLSTEKFARATGISPRPWREALEAFMKEPLPLES